MRIQILNLGFKGLSCVHTISDSFCAGTKTIIPDMIGLSILFTHKNGDFGAISATEGNCAARCC